jgi:ABC-type nickel/cobalt efflux system permease component RcnA
VQRATVLVAAAVLAMLTLAGPAQAHPLGNLSVNTFSRLVVDRDSIRVEVVVDAAEIPTLQAFPSVNRLRGAVPESDRAAYERQRCSAIVDSVELLVDGTPTALDVVDTQLEFPPGSAGLRTSRLMCTLASAATLATVGSTVDYAIGANADRVGWREIIAVPSGVSLPDSDVESISISDGLTRYPQNLLDSPPDQRRASFSVAAGDGAAPAPLREGPGSVLPRGLDRFTTMFTDLVSRQNLGLGFGLLAVLAAVVLGALHAFAPGHGKTVMAAYLVGREGSFRQAAIVGLSVTATHTLGVLALGIALTGAGLASPERVYPWLGLASGLLLAAIGVGLLLRRRGGHSSADHHLGEDHDSRHSHGLFSHTHLPPAGDIRGLVAIGFAGGLVPSPSALLVLLGGIALGRTWFGVLLVLAYGVGMATALITAGLLMVSARDAINRLLISRASSGGPRRLTVMLGQGLPAITASVVVVVGLGIALRSATQI